ESPESIIRRELETGSLSPDFPKDAGFPPGMDLRARYLELRESGKHREAVALLESAVKQQPDNPLVRELLTTPPAKSKAAPATMAVDIASLSSPDPDRGPAPAAPGMESRWRNARNLAVVSVGILSVTLRILAWHQGRDSGASPGPEPARAEKTPDPAVPRPAAPEKNALAMAVAPEDPEHGPRSGTAGAGAGLNKPSRIAPISPALALLGPAGTRITVNDTAEWISPGPKGGWALSPGLVNITLTPPGMHPPISSSLFLSPDSLYTLSLEEDGGFSVARKKR